MLGYSAAQLPATRVRSAFPAWPTSGAGPGDFRRGHFYPEIAGSRGQSAESEASDKEEERKVTILRIKMFV